MFYRAGFLLYICKHPDHFWTNFAFMYSSQCLDALDGLMARRWKMFSEFGAWLDVTLDDAFGACLITMLVMFYWHRPAWIVAIFILGVVFFPTGSNAYVESLKIANQNPATAKKIGAGGIRAVNFYEFVGCFLEEFMVFFLFLICFLFYNAAINNFWVPDHPRSALGFISELQQNVLDGSHFLDSFLHF